MKTVNVHPAKTQLSRLLEEVAAGQEIIIAKAGKPIARLVSLNAASKKRQVGILKRIGRLSFAFASDQIAKAAKESGFAELPVFAIAAALVEQLPLHHRNPFRSSSDRTSDVRTGKTFHS
jgi:prevent-host-death family protein